MCKGRSSNNGKTDKCVVGSKGNEMIPNPHISSTDDLWNVTGSTEGWQNAKVDLTSSMKSDFQVFQPPCGITNNQCLK